MTVTYEALHPSNMYEGTVAPSASANTKGTYVEFDASTAFAVDAFYVMTAYAEVARTFLMDVATGAAASETVIVANLIISNNTTNRQSEGRAFFPVAIGSGVRIAVRNQQSGTGVITGITMTIHIATGDSVNAIDSGVATTYGATTASTTGTTIDPGGTADTKGAYVQMTAATSTSNPTRWLIATWSSRNNSGMNATAWVADLATGAGGAETIIIPDMHLSCDIQEHLQHAWQDRPVTITTGTRIAARMACSTNDATDRLLDLVLVGVDGTLATSTGGGPSQLINNAALVGS